jgi:hypothetical protein
MEESTEEQILATHALIWEAAYKAGYAAAYKAGYAAAVQAFRKVAPRSQQIGPDRVRALILGFVNGSPKPVTAGEFSRLYPHISAPTRFDIARDLANEGLIMRDHETWWRVS